MAGDSGRVQQSDGVPPNGLRRLRRCPKTTEPREVTRPGFSMREIPARAGLFQTLARASPFQTLWMIDTSVVRERFTAVERDLNERSRHLLAAAEAKTAG